MPDDCGREVCSIHKYQFLACAAKNNIIDSIHRLFLITDSQHDFSVCTSAKHIQNSSSLYCTVFVPITNYKCDIRHTSVVTGKWPIVGALSAGPQGQSAKFVGALA